MASALAYLHTLLAAHPMMLLFLTIGLGYLLNQLQFRGLGLGLAAVLFVGLGLGAFGGGDFVLPELIGQLGLLLFIYPIGLQAGPAFFRLFRRRGLQICGLAGLATGLAAGLCWLAWRLLGLEPAVAVGLFCGGTTNTPALAMVTESLRGTPQAALPAVGYSIAYPLAVLIPILLAQLILVLSKADLGAETRRAEQASGGRKPAHAVNLRLDNPAWSGFCVADTPLSRPGIKLSRIQRGEEQVLAGPDTQLHLGDVLHVVGAAEQLRALESEIGAVLANPGPEASRETLDFRRMLLTNPELVGKTLAETGLEKDGELVVTRVRRGDVDFVPGDATVLERGDRLRIVAPVEKMPAISKLVGDSLRALSETDFASLSLGILLGLLLGELQIPLPGGSIKLGLAGGSLLISLLLGWAGRIGPIVWNLPMEVNLTFRQLGLMLFFAAVGLRSGAPFVQALQTQGLQLLLAGAVITLVSAGTLLLGALTLLRWDWVTATGTLAGGQTQPAILAFAERLAPCEATQIAYVSIMPAAMLLKILLAQLLLNLMH
ncbi:MAG: aspartate:alanine exchanger family transporter [Candidatus Sericytochromatia bacterium]